MHDIQPLQTALNLEALTKLNDLPTGAIQELLRAAFEIRIMYAMCCDLGVQALVMRKIEDTGASACARDAVDRAH
jgi:hypothetical protein